MRTWGEQANPRRQWPQLRINYFPHQGYKKMTLDETMLFEYLLSCCLSDTARCQARDS